MRIMALHGGEEVAPSLLPRESTGGCDEGAKSGNSVESRPSETATQERSLYVSVWVLLARE